MSTDIILWSRRDLIGAVALALAGSPAAAADSLEGLEQRHGIRLGAMMRAADGRVVMAHRADERFLFCSTFKVFLAAALFRKARTQPGLMDRRIAMGGIPKVGNSPVTGSLPAGSMLSVRELCAAVVEYSDNIAANHLLSVAGGPKAVTQVFRDLGDRVSRLDRIEPALNTGSPADLRDTTTPSAITASLGGLLLGNGYLDWKDRQQLLGWMAQERNGTRRIRAGMPAGWTVSNKPGTNMTGAVNDIAVVRTPNGKAFLLAVYVDSPSADIAGNEAIIARTAHMGAVAATRTASR
ncbi:class A beta-lactamase [Novosphingobium album (ex Hu et al. 2023)]|uniref:beta-lactamase n=1 Tax=Novosphingobium album (ex Hu et al. 2023) TaxID=2930093 RepID=A0ABT0AWB6_9SPHN|nr:class A beta-lactamase [Novosphingobium album (ex Hu et al. 2023)]MCJ2177131.1 class A beta-lactamase [Novosphingobium album (ex Hu et al. 2023)]